MSNLVAYSFLLTYIYAKISVKAENCKTSAEISIGTKETVMERKELFEKIYVNHKEPAIVSLAGKLIKKCNLTTQEEAINLCNLTFWLYIYGYTKEVEDIYEITKDVPFPGKAFFNVWTHLLEIWGLEVHILQQRNEKEKADEIIAVIDKYLRSSPLTDEQEEERRLRITYDFCCNDDRIALAQSKEYANQCRISSICQMLGRLYTGLYPNLIKEQARIEAKVEEYSAELKNAYDVAGIYEKTAEKMVQCLKKTTQTPIIYFTLEQKKTKIFDSKIGGAYYVPDGEPLVDEISGTPLHLLAQINFGQIKAVAPFPDKGLLQIFITGDDDLYGLDFDHPTVQERWAIRYYEEIPETAAPENIFTPVMGKETLLPFSTEYKLKAHKAKQVMTMSDYRFDKTFIEVCGKYLKTTQHSVYDLDEELYNGIEDKIQTYSCQIGGYPTFTQYDPRENMEAEKPQILLFQLDTVEDIMWGDSGVGNFFISEEDLLNRDFSNVLYNWDCC